MALVEMNERVKSQNQKSWRGKKVGSDDEMLLGKGRR